MTGCFTSNKTVNGSWYLERSQIGSGYDNNEGDIGGIQYRKKKWQIPKYRVENRVNTDTGYFNHIYNRSRILMVASI